MGDVGDYWRDAKEYKRKQRDKHGKNCLDCETYFPNRNPSILFPGQECRWCGYVDPRKEVNDE